MNFSINIWFDIQSKLCDKLVYGFIGGRGIGKTYSTIAWALNDFKKTGKQAIYLRRNATDLDTFSIDMKIYAELVPESLFDVKNNIIYIDGEAAVFGVALNTAKRSSSFRRVNKIIYDEAIPEQGKSYLKNEFSRLMNFYETVSRLRLNDKGENENKTEELVTLILLGNNSSRYNLWTSSFNVDFGGADKYSKGDIYFEILKNSEEIDRLRAGSRFGAILKDTPEYRYMYDNTDVSVDYSNVKPLPPNAEPICNISANGYTVGLFEKDGVMYFSNSIKNAVEYTCNKSDFNFIGKSKLYFYLQYMKNENRVYFKNKKIADIFYNCIKL